MNNICRCKRIGLKENEYCGACYSEDKTMKYSIEEIRKLTFEMDIFDTCRQFPEYSKGVIKEIDPEAENNYFEMCETVLRESQLMPLEEVTNLIEKLPAGWLRSEVRTIYRGRIL